MTFDEIKKTDHEYLMQTYNKFDVALEKGKGATAWDVNGKEYIDFTSGIGVNSLGFSDDGVADAITKQMNKIQHYSNLYYNPLQAELAKQLCDITGFDKAFFCNSGAEANECAIKLARKYSFDKYGKGRDNIVTLENSFHGRTVTTLAATGQDSFHNFFFPFTEGFLYAKPNMESVLETIDGKTCAVMLELIQGEGGVLPLEEAFVKELFAYCKKNDILMIVDEVQTGNGRTGAFYCYENYGITPDILSTAKGLGGGFPIGACLCTKELGKVLGFGTHGTTYGGNPVACAAALEVSARISRDDFLKEVQKKGEYLKGKLLEIEEVEEVRGKGLMLGVTLKDKEAREIAVKAAENGLLLLTAKTSLRLLPPLNITYDEIDKGLEILKSSI